MERKRGILWSLLIVALLGLGSAPATASDHVRPLKLYWHADRGDNFSTATEAGERAAEAAGYRYAGVDGHVFTSRQTGTVPLKLYWHAGRGDNFSTATSAGEQAARAAGYTFVRVEGYIYPPSNGSCSAPHEPLHLFWHAGRGDNFTTGTHRGAQAARAADYRLVRVEGCLPSDQLHPEDALDWEALDYGLYWFRSGHSAIRATSAFVTRDYFDPDRPTVVYVHGWQAGATGKRFRETWWKPDDTRTYDTSRPWKQRGWNMATFYWNQFADEDDDDDDHLGGIHADVGCCGLANAEAKIWTAEGPRGMAYKVYDPDFGNFSHELPRTWDGGQSAGDLLYQAYAAALRGSNPPEVRLVGHSLGHQMAVQLAYRVYQGQETEDVPPPLPKRVALLDPYGSAQQLAGLVDEAGEPETTFQRVNRYVQTLKAQGVAIERYTSTDPPFGTTDPNTALKREAAFVRLRPDAYGLDFARAHAFAIHWYFRSMAHPVPQDAAGGAVPSARFATSSLAEAMEASHWWDQVGNTWSPEDLDDDTFEQRSKSEL